MSLIPEFVLGLWNAWILILPTFIIFISGRIVNKGKFEDPPLNEKEKKLVTVGIVIMFTLFIYPIFLSMKLGTVWFYTGFLFYLAGMILGIVAEVNFATTPLDKPVTKGIYHFSRNPMYFGGFLGFIGISIASISWIYLLLATVWMILQHIVVVSEERFCLKKYGNAYREYMNRTPRWIGIPKSEKE